MKAIGATPGQGIEADRYVLAGIGELAEPVDLLGPHTSVRDVKKRFGRDEPLNAVVIVHEGKPVGMVMNIHLDRTLSQRFGVALYYEKPIEKIMDACPLVLEESASVEEVADMAMARPKSKLFDHIVVTKNGRATGIVSVQRILNAVLDTQKNNVLEMNRINEKLHREIADRRKAQTDLVRLNHELEDRVVKRTAEIQQSNEKLRQAAAAAEAANQSKSDFLANMSHELRTPLNHIIGFTELVMEQHFGTLNAKQTEYLTDVLHSSNHLLSLINDILDLSKVESGKLELYNSDVHLKKMLKNSLVMIKEKAQKHAITLSTNFEDVPETIEGDARKLKQILYNLLSNAVKFTPDGGQICLSAGRYFNEPCCQSEDDPRPIGICQGEFIEISVKDNGIGLKNGDMERIFNPFEQVESSRNRKYQGTGLGLSLTRKFVELHHGWIWAESDGEGAGACFRFIIPIRQQEQRCQLPAPAVG